MMAKSKCKRKYIQEAKTITCDTLQYRNFGTRKYLHIELKNDFDQNMIYILMNPSEADNKFSDDTVNRCIAIAYNYFDKYQIGSITIGNVLPYYESSSNKLQSAIDVVQKFSLSFYKSEIEDNLKVINQEIENSTYVFLATGGIPNVKDKAECRKLINGIYDCIEETTGEAFLGKKYKDKSFLTEKYSRHIHPYRRGFLDIAQLHEIKNGIFTPQGDPFKIKL